MLAPWVSAAYFFLTDSNRKWKFSEVRRRSGEKARVRSRTCHPELTKFTAALNNLSIIWVVAITKFSVIPMTPGQPGPWRWFAGSKFRHDL